MTRLSPTITLMLTLMLPSSPIMHASAFSTSVPIIRAATTPTTRFATARTMYNAKFNKIASSFDLDEILSNEKELFTSEEEKIILSTATKSRGNKRNANKDKKKKHMKEQLKQQKLEKQQLKKKQKSSSENNDNTAFLESGNSDVDLSIDYDNLIQNIGFVSYEVPSSVNGKRIDAALVELLNEERDTGLSISRSQCGTLLSHECVFIVPPENATEFLSAWQAHQKDETSTEEETNTAVPHSLIAQHSASIPRKSHILEPSSILIYPSRDSLLSKSSSALLSNFLPPTELVAQHIPIDILYEDEHMIVINKKAGMVV